MAATETPQQLELSVSDEPELMRECSICGGDGRSCSRSGVCSACKGTGWLPEYDPLTTPIPF